MRATRSIMGMPIIVEVIDPNMDQGSLTHILEEIFSYFILVDERFSTYKNESEIMQINRGEIAAGNESEEMKEIFSLAEKTRKETTGYFNIQKPDGSLDPSGIVKGWAINIAADILAHCGCKNFYIDAGGDIQAWGINSLGEKWSVGIRNPFIPNEIVKIIYPGTRGIATSGTSMRGQHIYNPHAPKTVLTDIASITVIGPNVEEADRFATAAFAMGKDGILFIEQLQGFEGYMIDTSGIATMTSGFDAFTS